MALPVLTGDEAWAVVKQLAELNPTLSSVIEHLGKEALQLPGVGLRDGLSGNSRTYEIAFVRSSPCLAFATFKAPSYGGTWMRGEQYVDRLSVEARFRQMPIPDYDGWLHLRTFGGEDWGTGHVKEDGSYVDTAIECIRAAYRSFDP